MIMDGWNLKICCLEKVTFTISKIPQFKGIICENCLIEVRHDNDPRKKLKLLKEKHACTILLNT